MADIKITELTEYTGALPADSFVLTVVGGSSKKYDASALAQNASPALTGIPTAPTASSGTNTEQIASTAFVQSRVQEFAIPSGGVAMWAGSTAPEGWLLCQGQAVSRTAYASIFTAIGESWGVGDGSTTFNLPDMRESAPVGVGTYSAVAGTTHGTVTAHDAFALAQSKDDQMQGVKHNMRVGDAGTDQTTSYGFGATSATNATGIVTHVTDGTNGTPRTGTVTRGKRIGINFIIKV